MPTELERELLPCPFCGTAEPQVVEQYAGTKQSQWSVICNGHWCDASVSSDGSGSLESAIETWNRRTDAAALQAQQPGAQAVELVDLSTALARVRARASESGTAKQHGPQFAAGLRAAANMLEGMRIAKSVHATHPQPPSIPEPSEADVELAWSTLRSTTQPRDSCACDGDMRAVLTADRARLRRTSP